MISEFASGGNPSSNGTSLKLDKNQENCAKHIHRSNFLIFSKTLVWFAKTFLNEIRCSRSNVYTILNVYTNLYKINVQVSVQVSRKCTG